MAKNLNSVIPAKAGIYTNRFPIGSGMTTINIFIFIGLAGINLLGVFLPELGFDALWYHLPLSKLLLTRGQWYFPGGLYYYSAMPRLAEVIALPLFSLIGYHGPKLVQFFSGLVVVFFIFRLAKKYSGRYLLALTAANLFYATWLVSWQSSSGYVDLVRTAFEMTALYFLVTKPYAIRHKLFAGIFLGLAIGTKWQALGSLALYALIFSPVLLLPALITASPWFLIAYHFTGNPVYPLFEKFMFATQLFQVSVNFYSLQAIFSRIVSAPIFLTRPSEDFLSPVSGLVYLISFLGLLSSRRQIRQLALLGIMGTFYLLLTPPPSTRYYLPYLPAVILAAVYLLSRLKDKIAILFITAFTISSFVVLALRAGSYLKYLPYLTGRLNPNQFLTTMSSRLPGTFIDSDGYVAKNLPPNGTYLIANLHNLYYFPYNFDHDSFAAPGQRYDYLVTRGADPSAIAGDLIHTNDIGIQIFKL